MLRAQILGRHAHGPSCPGGHEPSCSRPSLEEDLPVQARECSSNPRVRALTLDQGSWPSGVVHRQMQRELAA